MSTNPLPSQALLESATLPPTSLSMFPTELIIEIYTSADNFATVTALSSTSSRFRLVWRTYAKLICSVILARAVTCYEQAHEYVKAQSLDAASSERNADAGQPAIRDAQQCCENAKIACLALRHYETQVMECDPYDTASPIGFTEAQQTCFLQAWYRIHTLASLIGDLLSYSMLIALDLLQFEQMMEVFCWLMYWCPDKHRSELHISYQHDCIFSRHRFRRQPKSSIFPGDWYELWVRLTYLAHDLHRTPLDNRSFKGGGISFWRNIVYEPYLDIKESGKMVRLADMLPLIQERTICDRL